MIALAQRVSQARVEVGGQEVGAIAGGLLVLVCAEPADTALQAGKLVDKLLKLRVFSDAATASTQAIGAGKFLLMPLTMLRTNCTYASGLGCFTFRSRTVGSGRTAAMSWAKDTAAASRSPSTMRSNDSPASMPTAPPPMRSPSPHRSRRRLWQPLE